MSDQTAAEEDMSKHTSSDELDDILFDNIVAVGVREEGTVRDLDTLIIDRQKTVDALEAYIKTNYILKADVLGAIGQHEFGNIGYDGEDMVDDTSEDMLIRNKFRSELLESLNLEGQK